MEENTNLENTEEVKEEVTSEEEITEEVKEEDTPPTEEQAEDNNHEEDKSDEEDYSKVDSKEKATEILKEKGFDFNELQNEYFSTGKISDETKAKLAEVGITEDVMNNFIEGMEAKAELERNEMAKCIGGREKFDEVLDWSRKNLSKEQLASIDTVRDKYIIEIILKHLKGEMENKEGITPDYTKGEGGKPAVEVYRSQAEMFEAISNPKYQKDEAYRLDVQKKIAASREAGIDLGI